MTDHEVNENTSSDATAAPASREWPTQVVESKSLTIAIEGMDELSYPMAFNALLRPFNKVIITNSESAEKRVHIKVVIRAFDRDLSTSSTKYVALVPGRNEFLFEDFNVELIPAAMLHDAAEDAEICVALVIDEKAEAVDKKKISVLGSRQWLHTQGYDEVSGLLLTAFVAPHDPILDTVLSAAQPHLAASSKPAMPDGYVASWDGYQSDKPEQIDRQVESIVLALQSMDITYMNPPTSWDQEGQKIRTATEMVGDVAQRAATCLDSTILLASILERIDISPVLFIVSGHAFLGYWRVPNGALPNGAVELNVDTVAAYIEAERLKLVETTMICTSQLEESATSWKQVQKTPAVEYFTEKPHDFISAIDVRFARRATKIRPLPIAVKVDGNPTIVEYVAPDSGMSIFNIESKPGKGAQRDRSKEPYRVTQWKNRLLDLTLRNRLLNLTPSARIPVAMPESGIPKLEDVINSGAVLKLQPFDTAKNNLRNINTFAEIDEEQVTELFVKNGTLFLDLNAENYQTKLRALAAKAKLIEEETGSNNLFMTFGALKWEVNGRQISSPLVLVPVRLQSTGRQSVFTVSLDEAGESTPNFCLLEKFKQVTEGKEISALKNPPRDESGLDLSAIISETRDALLSINPAYRVEPLVGLSILNFGKFRLWKDLDESWEEFAKAPLVKHLIETPTQPFEDAKSTDSIEDLDSITATSPIQADGSQTVAIGKALSGQTFVLEGPPGTGKSQTITNILAKAIQSGKRVLFVAQKGEALNVVKDRLSTIGLSPFVFDLHAKDSKLSQARAHVSMAMKLAPSFNENEYRKYVAETTDAANILSRYAKNLHALNAAGFSLYSARHSDLIPGHVAPLEVSYQFLLDCDKEEIAEILVQLRRVPQEVGSTLLGKHVGWRFAEFPLTDEDIDQLLQLEESIDVAIGKIASSPALAKLSKHLNTGQSFEFLSKLLNSPEIDVDALSAANSPIWEAQIKKVDNSRAELSNLNQISLNYFTAEILNQNVKTFLDESRMVDGAGFFQKFGLRKALRAKLAPFALPGTKIFNAQLTIVLDNLSQLADESNKIRNAYNEIATIELPATWSAFSEDSVKFLEEELAWRRNLVSWIWPSSGEPTFPPESVLDVLAKSKEISQEIKEAADFLSIAIGQLTSLCGITVEQFDRWIGDEGLVQQWTKSSKDRRPEAGAKVSLERWNRAVSSLDILRKYELHGAVTNVLDGEIPIDYLATAFERGLASQSVRERSEEFGVTRFDSTSQQKTIQGFIDASARLGKILPNAIANGAIESRSFDPTVGSGRVGELIREVGRQRGGTLRDMIHNHLDLIQQLTPCMMMSPDTVARLLPVQAGLFDVVIFDEASQLRVADAIGALGRANSAVIVGDDKQMPPTTFAETQADADEATEIEEFGEIVEEQESILAELSRVLRDRSQRHMLSWHYRSHDESLIAFSNHEYYEDGLSSFPAPRPHSQKAQGRSDYLDTPGVKWVRVKDGTYFADRSAKSTKAKQVEAKFVQTNPVEAQAVVDEIVRRFSLSPDEIPSIGVVTLNQKQQKLIGEMLLAAPVPERVSNALTNGDIFVKNLETVQGDERDTILFSIGRSAVNGRVPLNFGPINNAGGHRRLNVAVTRARSQVVVFCSFHPSELHAEESASRGLKDLQRYLANAESGSHLASQEVKPERDDDNHRIDVANAIAATGLTVEQNIGLSDFRIDIAVRSSVDERFAIAVLLDNEPWSQRRTVGDRDQLPTSVLQGLMGWKSVFRVWLPEWLSDRDAVLRRLTEEFERVEELIKEDIKNSKSRAKKGSATAPKAAGREPAQGSEVSPEMPFSLVEESNETEKGPGKKKAAGVASRKNYPKLPKSPVGIVGSSDTFDNLDYQTEFQAVARTAITLIETFEPIHASHLFFEISKAFSGRKVTNRFQEQVLWVLNGALIPKFVQVEKKSYLWTAKTDPATWTLFRGQENLNERKLEWIHPREIQNAMLYVVNQSMGISQDELIKEVLTIFGSQRITNTANIIMEDVLNSAIKSGVLAQDTKSFVTVP